MSRRDWRKSPSSAEMEFKSNINTQNNNFTETFIYRSRRFIFKITIYDKKFVVKRAHRYTLKVSLVYLHL